MKTIQYIIMLMLLATSFSGIAQEKPLDKASGTVHFKHTKRTDRGNKQFRGSCEINCKEAAMVEKISVKLLRKTEKGYAEDLIFLARNGKRTFIVKGNKIRFGLGYINKSTKVTAILYMDNGEKVRCEVHKGDKSFDNHPKNKKQ